MHYFIIGPIYSRKNEVNIIEIKTSIYKLVYN